MQIQKLIALPKFARFLLLGVVLGFQLMALTGCVSSSPILTVRDSRVVGDELRLKIETAVSHSKFASESSTVSAVVGYYVLVDLKSTTPLPRRSRVIGPLYTNPAERSDIAYGGVDFTDRDRQARAATPRIFFGDQGNLVQLKPSGSLFERELLDVESHRPCWVSAGTQLLPSLSVWHTIFTPSRRWAVDYEAEVPRLYDMRTGEQKDDPWLQAALTDFRTRARTNGALYNVRLWLSDDLTHLVVAPDAGRVYRDGTPAKFENAGKQFIGDDYGLEYARPNPQSQIISKHFGMNGFTHTQVEGVFKIHGEPLFLYGTNGTANLAALTGETRFQASLLAKIPDRIIASKVKNPRISDSDLEKLENVYHFDKVLHQPEAERLVFVAYDHEEFTPYSKFIWGSMDVIVWHYPDGGVEYQRVNLMDIFKSSFGQYRALKSEPLAK